MKAEELRIGNLVKYKGEVVKVEQITKKKIGYHTQANESRMHYAQIAELEPIPLTEEIIGKYFIHCGASYLRDQNRAEMYQTVEGWCLNINNSNYTKYVSTIVEYLHDLQNAYYMTNQQELTII